MYRRHSGGFGAPLAILGLLVVLGVGFLVPIAQPVRAATVDVTIDNLAFTQAHIIVNVGDTVRWTNSDTTTHTVTSSSSPAAWVELFLGIGAQGSVTFNTEGVFNYFCRLHPFMTGSVTVGQPIPEFSGEFFVVIGLTAIIFGLMAVRIRRTP